MAREVFTSRFTFVAAAIGMAVGTGNIWRFPRDVGTGGGATFIIVLVLANLVWALPILMAESLLGSKSRLGTVGAFRDFMGRKFAWAGGFMGLVTIGIMFYYSVVCGWAIRYLVLAVSGEFTAGIGTEQTQSLWDNFTANPTQTILFHAVAIILVGAVVFGGLKGGLETVLKITVPALFIILAILAVQAMSLPGAGDGLRYLFVPDWSLLGDYNTWITAFTQMAFSTGAGWGLYLTYSVYMRQKEDFALNSAVVISGNHLASLLAGIAVICTVFALEGAQYATTATAAGDQGLMFVYLAALFGEVPGGTWFFAPLFFLVLVLAGLSSLIAMMELAVRNVMDFGIARKPAVIGMTVAAFAFGVPSALNMDIFTNQDNVWGIALLISGLLAAIAMMRYGLERARAELDADSDFRVGAWWVALIRIFPVMSLALFGWFIYGSISDPAIPWYDFFQTYSIMTMVVQWALLAAAVLLLNNLFARKIVDGPLTTVSES